MSFLAQNEETKEGVLVIYQKYLAPYERSEMACGIILVKCKILSEEQLETMKQELEPDLPHDTAQYIYDDNKHFLFIFLAGQKLSETHFSALVVKDYLQERDVLTGGIAVASVPESGASAVTLLTEMEQALISSRKIGGIKIFHPQQRQGAASAKVLVVDPDETVLEFLRIYLQRKGYRIEVAKDGLAGLRQFEQTAPDLVITELTLPGFSGYQLMEQISQRSSTPIIVLTHQRLEEDVRNAFAHGAADYITKPFSPIELEARMKRFVCTNQTTQTNYPKAMGEKTEWIGMKH